MTSTLFVWLTALALHGLAGDPAWTPEPSQQHDLNALIAQKAAAVNAKDITAYMRTVDADNREYYAEQLHWMMDIAAGDIADYKLQADKIELQGDSALVSLTQSYRSNGQPHSLSYRAVYHHTPQGWEDSDFDFLHKETEHLRIDYFAGDEATAERIGTEGEQAYQLLANRLGVPKDKTVVKVYNDKEMLRQSVKLSFAWQFGGWYEYPEAIKTFSDQNPHRSFLTTLQHEMTHKITIGWANNNLPYWLGEGLAIYYSDPLRAHPMPGLEYLSLAELEQINLEALTDPREISAYYDRAGNFVRYIVETYGEDKLKALIHELGSLPSHQGTVAQIDESNRAKFRLAVVKVLGVTQDQLDQGWTASLQS